MKIINYKLTSAENKCRFICKHNEVSQFHLVMMKIRVHSTHTHTQ